MPKLSHVLWGKKEKNYQQTLLHPEQQKIQQQLEDASQRRGAGGAFGESADYYRDLMEQDPRVMQQMDAPEMDRYNNEIVPGLSEQFGGMGGLSKESFRDAASNNSESLSERLRAMRSGLRMQGAQGLSNMANFALRPTVENIHRPETSGMFQSFAKGLAGAGVRAAGDYFSNEQRGGGIGGNRGGGGNYNYSDPQNKPYSSPYAATANPVAWR